MITTNEEFLASMAQHDPDRPGILSNLSNALYSRFVQKGSMDDINRAIALSEEALSEVPDNHPDLPAIFNALGITLQGRFERDGIPR